MYSKQRFEVDKTTGDMISYATYSKKDVAVPLDGEDVIIGVQSEYDVLNVIQADKIPFLRKYIKRQLDVQHELKARLEKTIAKHEHLDAATIGQVLTKLPLEKVTQSSKKLNELNLMVKDYYALVGARDQLPQVLENISNWTEQLDFIDKHFKA